MDTKTLVLIGLLALLAIAYVSRRRSPLSPRLRTASCFAFNRCAIPAKRIARSRMVPAAGLEPARPFRASGF